MDALAALVPLLAALSVAAAVVVVGWPHLARDPQADRLRLIRDERERIRRRERARLRDGPRLVERPQRLYSEIVRRLRLDAMTEDGRLARTLRRAGWRGRAPLYAYAAAQVVAPAVLLTLALLWLYLFSRPVPALATQAAVLPGAGVAGFFAPRLYVKNRIDKRRQAILRAWPDALDLLLICVEAGMTIETALERVAREIGGQSIELAEELHLANAELAYLLDRRQAYENLGDRTGLFSVRALATALIQSERHGTSLGQTLRVLAREQRDSRMMEAEKKAASLPPKLTVPMILFFLPVLFVVILAPAGLRLMGMD